MVSNLSVLVFAVVMALGAFSMTANALPMNPLQARVVGSLSCAVVKTGKLQLYNLKTKKTQAVTLQNNYRLRDVLAGRATPESAKGIGNPKLYSSYKGAKSQSFDFLACTESQRPGFEDFDPKSADGVYYGHLSATSKPANCATHRSLYADEAYLTSE